MARAKTKKTVYRSNTHKNKQQQGAKWATESSRVVINDAKLLLGRNDRKATTRTLLKYEFAHGRQSKASSSR